MPQTPRVFTRSPLSGPTVVNGWVAEPGSGRSRPGPAADRVGWLLSGPSETRVCLSWLEKLRGGLTPASVSPALPSWAPDGGVGPTTLCLEEEVGPRGWEFFRGRFPTLLGGQQTL